MTRHDLSALVAICAVAGAIGFAGFQHTKNREAPTVQERLTAEEKAKCDAEDGCVLITNKAVKDWITRAYLLGAQECPDPGRPL